MSTRTAQLKPGDLVRPTWDDRFRSTAPVPVTLVKDRPREIPAEEVTLDDLFENHLAATLKWTEIGQVLAKDGDWLMLLFGERYGWAPAKDFEAVP